MFGNIFRFEPFQVQLFQDVLKNIKTDNPIMIELGCGEAEYSKIFNDYFLGNCKNICIDNCPNQLSEALKNCPDATIIHGYVGELVYSQAVHQVDNIGEKYFVKDLIKDDKINILHMDIQGAETYVMQELQNSKYMCNIEYLFISLHDTYDEVKKCIPEYFEYLYEHPTEGGLGDGLIVLKNKNFE